MEFSEILTWVLLGGLAGWIASSIVKGSGQGIVVNVAVGIIGAFIGGWILDLIGGEGVTGFNVWSVVVAVFGAVLLLLVLNGFKRS